MSADDPRSPRSRSDAPPSDASTGGAPYGGRAAAYADPPPSDEGGNGHHAHPSPADALRDAANRFTEVKEYASYFVAAKLDGVKAGVRNVAIYAALGVVGLIVGGTVLVTASVLLLTGIAHGLGNLFGYRPWLGELVVGLVVLGGVAAGIVFGMKALTRTFKTQLVAKYEERQRQQRSTFGHDVEQRAVQQRAESWAGRHTPAGE